LGQGHIYLARTCFENAARVRRHPASCSFLALCQAKTRGKFSDAIALAREAIAHEPHNPLLYQNLGHIYNLAGRRHEAVEILREGVRRGAGEDAVTELNRIGTRKPPPFRRLHRNHPLNKYVGKLLARLRLR
jgi:predicted Zn-dependent protease